MYSKKFIVVLLVVVGASVALFVKLKVSTNANNQPSIYSLKNDLNWKKELEKIKDELRKDQKSSFWHHQAAVAYAALKDYKNFELEILKAIELEPDNPMSYYTAAAIYQQLGQHDEEQDYVWKALEADSNNPFGSAWLAELYIKKEKWDWAVTQYELTARLLEEVSGDEYIGQLQKSLQCFGLAQVGSRSS